MGERKKEKSLYSIITFHVPTIDYGTGESFRDHEKDDESSHLAGGKHTDA